VFLNAVIADKGSTRKYGKDGRLQKAELRSKEGGDLSQPGGTSLCLRSESLCECAGLAAGGQLQLRRAASETCPAWRCGLVVSPTRFGETCPRSARDRFGTGWR